VRSLIRAQAAGDRPDVHRHAALAIVDGDEPLDLARELEIRADAPFGLRAGVRGAPVNGDAERPTPLRPVFSSPFAAAGGLEHEGAHGWAGEQPQMGKGAHAAHLLVGVQENHGTTGGSSPSV
jgi:hypothetical protein